MRQMMSLGASLCVESFAPEMKGGWLVAMSPRTATAKHAIGVT